MTTNSVANYAPHRILARPDGQCDMLLEIHVEVESGVVWLVDRLQVRLPRSVPQREMKLEHFRGTYQADLLVASALPLSSKLVIYCGFGFVYTSLQRAREDYLRQP
jgi:hypothetical protein